MQSMAELTSIAVEQLMSSMASDDYDDPGDYIGDKGLLMCGKCHTPKQCITSITIGGITRELRPPCVCKCRKAQVDAEDMRREQEKRQRQIDNLRASSLMTGEMLGYTFDTFERRLENQKVYKQLKNYADRFKDMLRDNQGLLLWGQPGSGKTFGAACIANAVMAAGWSVMATSMVTITQSGFGEDIDVFLHQANKASLMIIDDLGAERATDTAIERVYAVIDSRARAGKPLILTTNLTLKQMLHPGDMRYYRIFDRAAKMCYPIEVNGISWRRESAADRFDKMRALLGG